MELRSLITPAELQAEFPASNAILTQIQHSRKIVSDIIKGSDPRLLVVVGPCSIHDISAALEYASRLKKVSEQFHKKLYVIMRVYFEKPRTKTGWKGLIKDPCLDNSFDVNLGLRWARKLLINLAEWNIPVGTEFLDTLIPPYISDLITWGAIGARTVESQIHRELASGLSMPIGFKNRTDGNIQAAIDAMSVARDPHCFLGVTHSGTLTAVKTLGNPATHIILRGSYAYSNYAISHIEKTVELLKKAELTPRLMVDCSHGNSMKNYERQPTVALYLAEKLREGLSALCGVMLESHLVAGKQEHFPGKPLIYGQSMTDGCLGWDDTCVVLEELASTVL